MIKKKDLLDYCREFNTENWFDFMRLWLLYGDAAQRWHLYMELRRLVHECHVTCFGQEINMMLQLYKCVKQRENLTGERIQTLQEAESCWHIFRDLK